MTVSSTATRHNIPVNAIWRQRGRAVTAAIRVLMWRIGQRAQHSVPEKT